MHFNYSHAIEWPIFTIIKRFQSTPIKAICGGNYFVKNVIALQYSEEFHIQNGFKHKFKTAKYLVF